MNRDERIENWYESGSAWEMAERIVDLEDKLEEAERLWREREKENGELFDKLMRAENALDRARELDPSRLESALRMYVAELDYDIHKGIECDEEDGFDHYSEEVEFFLRCWETAGEG